MKKKSFFGLHTTAFSNSLSTILSHVLSTGFSRYFVKNLFYYYHIIFSGAVKVTPGHDHNDYEIGKRHLLPFITMIDENGLISLLSDFKDEYRKFGVSDKH